MAGTVPDDVAEQLQAARECAERSRVIARGWDSGDERMSREVRELRLGFDRLAYAVELLARRVDA